MNRTTATSNTSSPWQWPGARPSPDWAEENEVPLQTCYAWRKTRQCEETVREVRRHMLDSAVGQIVGNLAAAARRIVDLSTTAESESVQLQAARAVINDGKDLAQVAALEKRIKDIERQLADQKTVLPYPWANVSRN